MLIVGISAFFALLVFSPYIVGVLKQLPGTTFVGVVHYPLDYYAYLSYMAQGKLRWLTAININTQEMPNAIFYHWFYVLSGRVFATLGISNVIGYQLLILGLSVVLLLVSYRLICLALPSRTGRTIALILFLVSNAWPFLTHTDHGWMLGYYYSWYNYGEPFTRFSSIPHHLLAQSILIVTLLLLVHIRRLPRSRHLVTWPLFLVSGFLLASTQTPLVMVVLLTYAVFWAKDIISVRDPRMFLRTGFTSEVFPALLLMAAGAGPYMVYLRILFQNPAYRTITDWESTLNVHQTLLQFFQVNGPVVLLGLVGLPAFLSARTTMRRIIVVCTGISWGIFFSPIPSYISVLNIRFLSVVPTITMACAAAALIESCAKRFRLSLQHPIRIGFTVIILALTIPPLVQQQIARTTFASWNAYYFLPNGALDAYKQVEKVIRPEETCLVAWPFHISFAGLTGRRAFTTNEYSTINYPDKERQIITFFSDTTPLDQKAQILTTNRISCVVTYSFTKNLPPSLTPVYANSYMTVYRVTE